MNFFENKKFILGERAKSGCLKVILSNFQGKTVKKFGFWQLTSFYRLRLFRFSICHFSDKFSIFCFLTVIPENGKF